MHGHLYRKTPLASSNVHEKMLSEEKEEGTGENRCEVQNYSVEKGGLNLQKEEEPRFHITEKENTRVEVLCRKLGECTTWRKIKLLGSVGSLGQRIHWSQGARIFRATRIMDNAVF